MTRERAPLIGIDLGTTYSLVAVFDGQAPRVLENELGEHLIPSAVAVTADDAVLVGAPALALATIAPERTARWFKRDMGTDRTYRLGTRAFSPVELSAMVLAEVKATAERALGTAVREAVVTVPAYFGELQRRATRDACELAGLEVERIVNEPTAAALAYGLNQRDQELRAVVLDLGGGTFDVTLLQLMEGVVEIQASAGDARLGGEDFSDAVARALARQAASEHGVQVREGSPAWARLREAGEIAKRQLTVRDRAPVALPALVVEGRSCDVELFITRDQALAAWRPLLERMSGPVRRVLGDAGVGPEDVDVVLLVGGATRMPCVVEFAARTFGKLPLNALPPDEAVALGAAIQAALKSGAREVDDLVVTDVAPFSLGIATAEQVGGQLVRGLFSPIIERGTVLPVSRVESFRTMADDQTRIDVEVFQGEHSLCKDNQRLGEYVVKGIPRGPAGTQSIEVRFTYDMNGILEVDTTIVATGKTVSTTIERSPGRLSRAELNRVRQELARLKFHPRDALPNITALNRAEALYVELTGPGRHLLGNALAAFRLALEGQRAEEITRTRLALTHLVSELRRPGS